MLSLNLNPRWSIYSLWMTKFASVQHKMELEFLWVDYSLYVDRNQQVFLNMWLQNFKKKERGSKFGLDTDLCCMIIRTASHTAIRNVNSMVDVTVSTHAGLQKRQAVGAKKAGGGGGNVCLNFAIEKKQQRWHKVTKVKEIKLWYRWWMTWK